MGSEKEQALMLQAVQAESLSLWQSHIPNSPLRQLGTDVILLILLSDAASSQVTCLHSSSHLNTQKLKSAIKQKMLIITKCPICP